MQGLWCLLLVLWVGLGSSLQCSRCLFDYKYHTLLQLEAQMQQWEQANRSRVCYGYLMGLMEPQDLLFDQQGRLNNRRSAPTPSQTGGPCGNLVYNNGMLPQSKRTLVPPAVTTPATSIGAASSLGQGQNTHFDISAKPLVNQAYLQLANPAYFPSSVSTVINPNRTAPGSLGYGLPMRVGNVLAQGYRYGTGEPVAATDLYGDKLAWPGATFDDDVCTADQQAGACAVGDLESDFFSAVYRTMAGRRAEASGGQPAYGFRPSDIGIVPVSNPFNYFGRPYDATAHVFGAYCLNDMDCDHHGGSASQGGCVQSPVGSNVCSTQFGIPTTGGACKCTDMNHIGRDCERIVDNSNRPNPYTDTQIPDTVFDVCMGRGVPILNPSGVGWYCACGPGWAGGTDPRGWVDYSGNRVYWSAYQHRLLYSMALNCNGNPSFDETTDLVYNDDRYWQLHQCMLFVGDSKTAQRYTFSGTVPAVLDGACYQQPGLPSEFQSTGPFCLEPAEGCDIYNTAGTFWDPTTGVNGCRCKPLFGSQSKCHFYEFPVGPNPTGGFAWEVCSGHGRGIVGLANCQAAQNPALCAVGDYIVGSVEADKYCVCDPGWGGVQTNIPVVHQDSQRLNCGVQVCKSDAAGRACGQGGTCVITDAVHGKGYCKCEGQATVNSTTGLCDYGECARVNGDGPECGVNLNLDVCDHILGHSLCHCHLNQPRLPTMQDDYATWVYRDQSTGLCTATYEDACKANPGDAHVCSGHGDCVPKGCKAGDAWSNCSVDADLDGPPQCMCDGLSKGQFCEQSVCGGFSVDKPCTAGDNGVVVTGQCSTLSHTCVCQVIAGQPYVGPTCAQAVSGCAIGTVAGVCANHGTCVQNTSDPTGDYYCKCGSHYLGQYCETLDTCTGACATHQGHCVNNQCECFRNYGGANCATDFCTATGGTVLTPDTCQCPPGSTQYPSSRDPLPYAAFRGCRKLCNMTHQLGNRGCEECGSYDLSGKTRCDVSTPIAANDLTQDPVCDCSGAGENFLTRQVGVTMQLALDGSGVCEPKCVHCLETLGPGTCDDALCPQRGGFACQYQGPRCNFPLCGPHRHSVHNGTACECWPSWLYAGDASCTVDVCTATGGVPPTVTTGDAAACSCPPGGLTPDLDPTSPTYRLCVLDCGLYGHYNHTTAQCDCDTVVYQGPYCNISQCPQAVDSSGHTAFPPAVVFDEATRTYKGDYCACTVFGYTGTYCNETNCVGGAPPPTNANLTATCVCELIWEGPLCAEHRCVHGTPSHNGTGASCVCTQGWTGTYCDHNECGTHVPTTPIPCGQVGQPTCVYGGRDYNCECGVLGTFSSISGECEGDYTCAQGHVHSGQNYTDVPRCVCQYPWIGERCDQLPCGASSVAVLGSGRFNVTGYTEWAHGDGSVHCDCQEPWTGITDDCQLRDCAILNLLPDANPDTTVVRDPTDPTSCRCADYGNYDLVLTHGGQVCHLRCNPLHTNMTLSSARACVCQTNYSGRRCDVYTPPPPPPPPDNTTDPPADNSSIPANPGVNPVQNNSHSSGTRPVGPANNPNNHSQPVCFGDGTCSDDKPIPPTPEGVPNGTGVGTTTGGGESLTTGDWVGIGVGIPVGLGVIAGVGYAIHTAWASSPRPPSSVRPKTGSKYVYKPLTPAM